MGITFSHSVFITIKKKMSLLFYVLKKVQIKTIKIYGDLTKKQEEKLKQILDKI